MVASHHGRGCGVYAFGDPNEDSTTTVSRADERAPDRLRPILQQAGTAILAQANSAPQDILALLR